MYTHVLCNVICTHTCIPIYVYGGAGFTHVLNLQASPFQQEQWKIRSSERGPTLSNITSRSRRVRIRESAEGPCSRTVGALIITIEFL